MTRAIAFLCVVLFATCTTGALSGSGEDAPRTPVERGYAPVDGLSIYYEVHGVATDAPPLVLLHGGGSTIDTSFGKLLPALAATRQVIAFEQQGHGRTADVDRPFTFEQSADDTAALLRWLHVARADLCGYSNGGSIALQVAVRHPELVRKLIVVSAMFRRDGLDPALFRGLEHASPENMPAELRDAYLRVAPHPEQLPVMVQKCAERMLRFADWPDDVLRAIAAPTLVVVGDADVVRAEHAVQMFRLLPHAQLAVLAATDHMAIVARKELLLPQVEAFLDAPMP